MGEIKDERGAGSGDDGQYLGEDLARDVLLDPMVERQQQSGNVMDDRKAEEYLVANRGISRDAAEVIVDALPDALHNESVFLAIDLRPYMAALNGKTIVRRLGTSPGISFDDSLIDVFMEDANKATIDTTEWLAKEEAALRESAHAALEKSSMTIEERNAAIDKELSFDPARASYRPGTTPDVPEDTSTSATGGMDPATGDWLIDEEGLGDVPRFPVDEMRAFIQTEGVAALEELIDVEAQQGEALGGGFFPVQATTEIPSTWADSGSKVARRQGFQSAQSMSIAQARNLLSSMTPTEVKSIQSKLAAAGYMDQVEGGIAYVPGDAFDEATRAAWDLLLTDSIQQNKPIPNVIGERSKNYRNEVRMARMGALTKSDPLMTKMIADDWAMSTIGRKLTQEEADAMHASLMQLTAQRSRFVAGARDNETATGLQGDYGFTSDDVELQLQRTFGREELDTLQGERLYALNKFVGG